jgi:hypothetical protein
VKKKGSYFQVVFRHLRPPLGYQPPVWAVAHRLCRVVRKILHEGVRFIDTASNLILRLRSDTPGGWRKRFASSVTRSQSDPSPPLPPKTERKYRRGFSTERYGLVTPVTTCALLRRAFGFAGSPESVIYCGKFIRRTKA